MHIPPMNLEIERIHAQALTAGRRTLAITAANSGEGTTSVALALAHRNLLAGRSTVIVDLNLHRPALKPVLAFRGINTAPSLLDHPQLIATDGRELALTGITVPSRREALTKLRRPGVLAYHIDELLRTFDTVIFDTSSINRVNANNMPAEQVAAACDGAVLVVLAGQTRETTISAAIEKLRCAGAVLVGCVLNDRDNPELKDELLREIARLPPALATFSTWLRRKILDTPLLSLEV